MSKLGKHIDHQIVFFANENKVVCHFYNTTQKILVNGNGYINFVNLFLKPYFESKITLYEKEIEDFNHLVLETLGTNKVKRSNVKYKASATFPCVKCDFLAKTMPSLDKHTKMGHALSFIKASNALSISLASSRNNSILDENLSSTDLKDETY